MRISVVIPVYNSEQFLDDCLKSVMKQISYDDEIILVENGSKDNTPVICKTYEREYDFIKYIELGAVGVSVARNEGVKVANGDWITFVDSDDALLPNAFDVFTKPEINNADIIVAGYSRDLSCWDSLGEISEIESDLLAKGVLQFAEYKNAITGRALIDDYNNWASWGKFFKREFLIDNDILFPAGVRLSEDTAFCFQAYCAAKKIIAVKQRIYFYRLNENSVVKTYNASLNENNLLLINYFEKYLDKFQKAKSWKKEYAAFCVVKTVDVCLSMKKSDLSDLTDDEIIDLIKEILSEKSLQEAIKSASFCHLINGKKNNILYAIVLLLLKLKKYKLILKINA